MYSEVRRWGRPRKYTDAKFSWFQCLLWVTSGEQKIPGTAMAWATALKKMSRICRFWSLWFDVTVEPGLIRLRTEPKGKTTMRFMVIVKATKDSEAGKMPSEQLLSAMAKFNEEMVKAGVMLDGNGLQPSSKGARVRFRGDNRSVIDGPFAETQGTGCGLLDLAM